METAVQNVSEEVILRAEAHANNMYNHWIERDDWKICRDAYIAGALSQKPIEHTKEPNTNQK